MDRAFASGSSASPPSAPGSPSIGYPTAGNPGGGTPATKPGPYWYHMITEELRGIIAAAGLTPSQSDITQLLQALPNALASRPEMAKSFSGNSYQKLPGGLIIQFGATTVSNNTAITFPITFPNAVRSIVLSNGMNTTAANATTDVSGFTTSGFNASAFNAATGANTTRAISWVALGN